MFSPTKAYWVLEIGNTNLHGGVFSDTTLRKRFALPLDRLDPARLDKLFHTKNGTFLGGMLCVTGRHPPLLRALSRRKDLGSILTFRHDLRLPLTSAYRPPESLGPDRIASCVGALDFIEPPYAVLSLGTAATVTVVDRGGVIVGGTIFPGLNALARGLAESCPDLPKVRTATFAKLPADDTRQAIAAGRGWGLWFAMTGLIREMETTLGYSLPTLLTGGGLKLLPRDIAREMICVPDLALLGLARIYRLNA